MQTQVDSSRATAPSAAALLLSFCVGFGTLLSQLAFTRILSFVLWNHLVYLIITMAFCGFALAGTLLAIRPQWLRINHDRVYAVLCGLLSLTLVGGLAVIAYAPLQTPDDMTKLSSLTSFLLINALLILPYFCFGALLSFLLAAFSTAANKVYGVNLLGSALGCLGFVLLLPLTSGPLLVALTAAFFSVVALCFARRRVAEAVFALISTVAAIGFVAVADTVPLKPEPTKTVHHLCGNNGPEFTEWNPLSRVDVVPCGDNLKVIYYDAAAPAFLNRNTLDPHTPPVNYATHNFERQTVPFAFRPKPEHVLVLGVGGARDVVKALQMGARAVTGVEIHDTTYSLLHDRYDDYLNGLAHWPNVKFFHADGRSFVRRYDATYDVVMLVGLDSFAALSSGAYVLYESYIYTRQALQDYFRRLRPGGVIALSRWLFVSKPRESLRLFSTAYEALKAEGIERPLQHLFVSQYESYFAEDRKQQLQWANVLVFKEPLTSNRITGALRYLTPPKHDVLYRPDRDVARHKISQPFYAFAQAVKQGRKKTFVDAYPFDISAVTDDSPFFFQYAKIKKVASLFRSKTVDFDELVHGNWSWFILLCIMIQSTVFAIVVALLPYRRMRRSGAGHRQLVATSLLFAALGFGYVCLQMGLIQKLVLYLTHPVYSIAVVVPALLLFGGMGALFSLRIRSRHLVLASTLAIVVAIVAVNITLDSLLSWLQPEKLWLRCAVVVLLLSPIGLLLGVPFANAMRGLSTQKKALVPWAFGLNGALSVLGSAGAVVLAIGGGFTFVIWIAAAVYGLAAVGAALESSHGRC